jgi:outer membrane protein assembly factor BamE (lipoprotein component of BamABCDE complex)
MKVILTILTLFSLASCGVQQNLSSSFRLSPGMTKTEVEKLMGYPVKSDFKKNVEEWHYCRTGIYSDEFISLFFFEGKLVEKLNYTVTIADTRGVTGSCENFIKMGNYREPDRVIELRMR